MKYGMWLPHLLLDILQMTVQLKNWLTSWQNNVTRCDIMINVSGAWYPSEAALSRGRHSLNLNKKIGTVLMWSSCIVSKETFSMMPTEKKIYEQLNTINLVEIFFIYIFFKAIWSFGHTSLSFIYWKQE